MSDTRFMQTVLFGGYERSAVEERFEALTTQLFTMKNELRESRLLLAELKKGSDEAAALEEILAGERVKMAELEAQNETVTNKIRAAESDLAARDKEIEQLKAELAQVKDTLAQKIEKLTYLEASSDGEALSAVFIEAQKSADLLVSMAKKDAAALDSNSKRLAENLVTEANNTAKKLIFDAEKRSAEMLADSETRSEQLATASVNMRATVLEDVTRLMENVTSLKNAFGRLKEDGISVLTDAEEMLEKAEVSLKAGGVPEYREPVKPEVKLPEAPEYEPVDHSYYTDTDKAAAEAKIQREEDLKRLRAMANSIHSDDAPKTRPVPPPKAAPELAAPAAVEASGDVQNAPASSESVGKIVPNLAALAAQADAISQQGKKKYKYPGHKGV